MPDIPDFAALLGEAAPGIPATQGERLVRYLELAWEYGAVLNLTAFKGPRELLEGLVVDALRLLDLGPIPRGASVADVGSGNGSPVVPLAVRCQQARFTAIEANRKRGAFLRTVAATLGLSNLKVAGTRVEQLFPAGRCYDLVTSRAFAPPFEFLDAALKLARPGGEIRGFAGAERGRVTRACIAHGTGQARFREFSGVHGLNHVWSVLA